MATAVNSGQKATSASINAIFGLMLSGSWSQRVVQAGGGTITSTGTTFTTPATPCTTTITSAGTTALVIIGALMTPSANGNITRGSLAVSGATTTTSLTNLNNQFFLQNTITPAIMVTSFSTLTITPGSNTYTLQFVNSTGTTCTIGSQSILVIAP